MLSLQQDSSRNILTLISVKIKNIRNDAVWYQCFPKHNRRNQGID